MLALTLPRPRICRSRRDAIAAVVVVLQPVSCTLTRFSALARFHNDKSLVDLTAAAAADDDDDGGGGGGGGIATVFNARVAFPLQQTAPSLYNRFCMNVESAASDYYKLVSYFLWLFVITSACWTSVILAKFMDTFLTLPAGGNCFLLLPLPARYK